MAKKSDQITVFAIKMRFKVYRKSGAIFDSLS